MNRPALRQLDNPSRAAFWTISLVLFALTFIAQSIQGQTVYRWIADNVDFGEAESPWTNVGSWDANGAPPTILLNANDVVELNGDGGNGFGTSTKEITINAATGSMTVGTLRFGDRDLGSALIIEDSDGLPTTAQAEGIIFDTSITGDGASDGIAAALYHGLDNLGVQDERGVLSVGDDVSYGTGSDAIEVGVTLRDADGFIFDGFNNFRIDAPMVVDPSITGGADFWKRGQGNLVFDENSDPLATNGSLIGVKDLYVQEGEFRIDGDNGDPDGINVLQTLGNWVIGTGATTEGYRSVIPVLRIYRNNTGANISNTYTGTSETSEVGGNIQLNVGVFSVMNSNIGGGAGEVTVEPEISVMGAGNQLELSRANNNSETILFTGDITGTGELFKDNSANMVSTANNTFAGILGVAQQSDADGGNQGGIELAGADGAFSAISELRLFNNGSLFLTNGAPDETDGVWAGITTAVNNDRINDTALITMQDMGKIEIVGNDSVPVSETLGAVNVLNGRPAFEFDLNNGTTSGQINLTLASITRAPGAELRFRIEDGYTAGMDGTQAVVTVEDGGAALGTNLIGGGGAAGSTTMSTIRGVTFGIFSNFGDRISTIDPATNQLRPLDHDPSSPGFEFVDATGGSTAGAQRAFDPTWNAGGVANTESNVMWYFTQVTNREGATDNAEDFEQGRVIFDDVTINSAYITGLANNQLGGNDNLRRQLAIDEDATLTITSGTLFFSRETDSASDTVGTDRVSQTVNDVFVTGGTINLGEEGFLKNRINGVAYLTSDIVTGSGGLTVSSGNSSYIFGDVDLGGGALTLLEGPLQMRNSSTLTSTGLARVPVNLYGNGSLNVRDGVRLSNLDITSAPGAGNTTGGTVNLLRSEGSAGSTVSDTNFILSNYDQLGEAYGTQQISQQLGTVLNLENVSIYAEDPLNQATTDGFNGDPQNFQFYGETSKINFNGIISDVKIGLGENGTGVLAPTNLNDLYNTDLDSETPNVPITSNGFGANGNVLDATSQDNTFFRVRVDGGNLGANRYNPYDEVGDNFTLNFERSGQQFNGALQVGNGILRFTSTDDAGDGVSDGSISFFHDEVANSRDYRDFWTSFRLVDDITGNDNRAVIMLTQPGQVFNINGGDSRADTDSGEDNFAIVGYSGLSGSAQFGDTTYNIGGGYGKRLQSGRELMMYAAGDKDTQGTLNWRMGVLDPGTERDGELTKIGRGIVNIQKNPLQDDGNSTFQFDHGLNMFGGELHFDFDVAGDTGIQFTSNDGNAASTPDLRFRGGDLRILGDTNETRNFNNIDGDLIVNQGHSEFEYRARGGNATITAGGASTDVIRTAGGALNFVVDLTNAGSGTFKATYENATITAGSVDDLFDSRLGGAFTVGTMANTVVGWAAFDNEFEINVLDNAAYNGTNADVGAGLAQFGTGVNTQIEENVASTGTSTGSMRIDAMSTVDFSSAAGTFVVEDGILIPSTNAGAVVLTGTDTLSGGVVTGGTMANELLIHNYGSGGLEIVNPIVDNGAKTDLTIGGTGTTTLSGENTHTGNTYVNSGSTVIVNADSAFGTFDTTNGYGIADILLYYAGDNYETGTGTTFELKDRSTGLTYASVTPTTVAPTVTMELVNDLGIRNIRLDTAGSGYDGRPIAVFDDLVDLTGSNHGQGARAAVVLDGANVVLNGGAVTFTEDVTLNSNRSIVLQGDGGTINVADGKVLTYEGFIVPERHTSRNNANGQTYVDYFSGDLDINADGSTGTIRYGALVDDNANSNIQDGGLYNTYHGMTNIYAGTVELFGQPMETQDGDVAGQVSSQTYIQPFGTVASFEDGTILHENTTLRIMMNTGTDAATAYDGSAALTGANNNLNDTVRIWEWFTMKNGAFIQEGSLSGASANASTGRNVSLDGTIQIESGSNVFMQSHGGNEFLLNYYSGELIGDSTTRFVKLGDQNLRVGGANDNFEGQWVVMDGILEFNNHGNVSGVGTSEILVGGNLTNAIYTGQANPIALPADALTNTGTVGIYIRDDGGMPGETIEVTQNIVLVDDTGGSDQTYRVGAWFLADMDRALYSGNLDMTDLSAQSEQVQFYYRDDYTGRNNGSPTGAERSFIEFSGDISGSVNGRSVIEQSGTGNGGVSAERDLDFHAYFVFSGDNTGWGSATERVSMEIGLRSNNIDTNRTTYWRAGSDTAFNEYQNMFMNMGSRLQAGGNNVTIGNLVSDADNGGNNTLTIPATGGIAHDGGPVASRVHYAFLENGSNTEGTVTIRQTENHEFTGMIRNGFDPLISASTGELGGEINHGNESGSTEGAALNVIYAGTADDVNLTLTERNRYTGTTEVQSGILQIGKEGDGSWGQTTTQGGDEVGSTGTGITTVTGGTLAGSGNVRGSLVLGGGVVAPGDMGGAGFDTLFVGDGAAGDLTVTDGTLTFGVLQTIYNQAQVADGTYNVHSASYDSDINTNFMSSFGASSAVNPSAFGEVGTEYPGFLGDDHDHLEISGNIIWGTGSTGKVAVVFDAGYTDQVGDTFNFLDWFGIGSDDWTGFDDGATAPMSYLTKGGNFGDFILPTLSDPDWWWDTRLFQSDGVVFIAAPEPSRAVLIGLGLAALTLRRRRRISVK